MCRYREVAQHVVLFLPVLRLEPDEEVRTDSFSRSAVTRAGEPGTTKTKVTDKGALSKHSCRICVYIRAFVYTHTRIHRMCVTFVPKGFCGRGLNKSPAHSRSPESQHLSAHIICQIPEPSLKKEKKKKTHSAFFLSLSVAPSIGLSARSSLFSVPRVLK